MFKYLHLENILLSNYFTIKVVSCDDKNFYFFLKNYDALNSKFEQEGSFSVIKIFRPTVE